MKITSEIVESDTVEDFEGISVNYCERFSERVIKYVLIETEDEEEEDDVTDYIFLKYGAYGDVEKIDPKTWKVILCS